MTRELCREPGVLTENLQEVHRVVRDDVQVEIPLDEPSYNEVSLIEEELRRQAAAAFAEKQCDQSLSESEKAGAAHCTLAFQVVDGEGDMIL
jgi:hypothetical protein